MTTAAVVRAKAAANSARCKNNIRQVGLALCMYRGDFESYPHHVVEDQDSSQSRAFWFNRLAPYVAQTQWHDPIFRCPGYRGHTLVEHTPLGSYAYNAFGVGANIHSIGLGGNPFEMNQSIRASTVRVPSRMYALGDANLSRYLHRNSMEKLSGLAWFHWKAGKIGSEHSQIVRATKRRHSGVFNLSFCDGHVEALDHHRLFRTTDQALKLWNNDHQPHRELLGE